MDYYQHLAIYIQIQYDDFEFNPCKTRQTKKLICTNQGSDPTPTPTPIHSGSLCSGSLDSGSLDSGSLCSGNLTTDLDTPEIFETTDTELFNVDDVSYQNLNNIGSIVFTSCDKNVDITHNYNDKDFEMKRFIAGKTNILIMQMHSI